MKFTETKLPGVFKIDLDKIQDTRGFFARYFCKKEFAEQGLKTKIVQINNSFNTAKGTLRGIHYQAAPYGEVKIVRCFSGALYDVVIDLRIGSPTYLQWLGVELSAANRTMLYIPKGFGHAFITLEHNTEALYLVTEYYTPGHEGGIRWNDPLFNIRWPLEPTIISEKDADWPNFSPEDTDYGLYRYTGKENG